MPFSRDELVTGFNNLGVSGKTSPFDIAKSGVGKNGVMELIDALCKKVPAPKNWEGEWEDFCDSCSLESVDKARKTYDPKKGAHKHNAYIFFNFTHDATGKSLVVYFNCPTTLSKASADKIIAREREKLLALARKLRTKITQPEDGDLDGDEGELDNYLVDLNMNVLSSFDGLDKADELTKAYKTDTSMFVMSDGTEIRPFLTFIKFGANDGVPVGEWDNMDTFIHGNSEEDIYGYGRESEFNGGVRGGEGFLSFYETFNYYMNAFRNHMDPTSQHDAISSFLVDSDAVHELLQDLDTAANSKVPEKDANGNVVLNKKGKPAMLDWDKTLSGLTSHDQFDILLNYYPKIGQDIRAVYNDAREKHCDMKTIDRMFGEDGIMRNFHSALKGNNIVDMIGTEDSVTTRYLEDFMDPVEPNRDEEKADLTIPSIVGDVFHKAKELTQTINRLACDPVVIKDAETKQARLRRLNSALEALEDIESSTLQNISDLNNMAENDVVDNLNDGEMDDISTTLFIVSNCVDQMYELTRANMALVEKAKAAIK